MPAFSIIMPAYNSAKTITTSIHSVMTQTFLDWELVIVDDCSTDKTLDVLKTFNDKRIKVITNESNQGTAKSRNIAIEIAKGRFIAFLDSDDVWSSDKLEKQYDVLLQDKYSIVCSSYYTFKKHPAHIDGLRKVSGDLSYKDILKTNRIGCLTAVFDTKKVGKRYMVNCGHEDYTLWLDILRDSGRYCYAIESPLAFYRVHPNSLSSNKIKMCMNQWNIYRKVEKLKLIDSVFYFFCYIFLGLLKRM